MAVSRLAVCSWSLGPRGPRHLVEMLGELDIGAVQLALVPVVTDPAAWGRAAAVIEASGARCASGMLAMVGEDYTTPQTIRRTGGVRPDATWPDNRRRAAEVAAAAGDAGIGLVTFHAGFIDERPDDPARLAMIGRLRDLVDLFERRSVAVAFETGQETAETLAGALDQLDRPGAGVNFDPANMILYGMGDPVAALRDLADRVRQIHVKDAVAADEPGAWGTEVPAGRGAVRWGAFFDAARALGPIDFVIERESGGDRLADVRAARALIEEHAGAVA